ncbi:hypothetical protein D3C77_500930 [compost metagenome]
MRQPGEGHGFHPVGINAVARGGGHADARQQLGQAAHQRMVMGSAPANQNFSAAGLGRVQGLDDAERGQFQQRTLYVFCRNGRQGVQVALQPGQVEQFPASALGPFGLEEWRRQQALQQGRSHFAAGRPGAAIIVALAALSPDPGIQ